ncbi:hypothetical protein C0J52_16066 [Blattella germanica]|nr:hypothetical protein C0J52_16066 [Blattella germanica]
MEPPLKDSLVEKQTGEYLSPCFLQTLSQPSGGLMLNLLSSENCAPLLWCPKMILPRKPCRLMLS